MKKLLISIKNILLWSYDRGTWQYDLLCLLIIAAILLIPSKYFGDRDRPLRTSLAATSIQNTNTGTDSQNSLKSAPKSTDLRHWDVEATKLNALATRINQPDALKQNPHALLELYLREKVRVDLEVSHFEAQYDSRGNISSYRAWFH